MKADELLAIDIGAEVATLCGAQLQGPWQVPAELVRLANHRGAARVEIDRHGRGFRVRCDGVLASADELKDLVEIFNREAPRRHRQEAISRVESAGLSALLWASGLPGSRLDCVCRTGGWQGRLEARRGRVDFASAHAEPGPPSTTLIWRCRGLARRRAVAWLRTALRFVPIPVTVDGKPVDRGFRDGLYRMRITEPLPGEIAVTRSGETPELWLLEHGVLSARAVVPGFPAFSAALEMSSEIAAGSSADQLRAAANPHLGAVIDEAARMLIMLVDRLSAVEELVRRRLTRLLLAFAVLGHRRGQVMEASIVSVRRGHRRSMESPVAVAQEARRHGGVLRAVDPGNGGALVGGGYVVEGTIEERTLLAELLDLRIENLGDLRRPFDFGPRIVAMLRRGCRAVLSLGWARPLDLQQLSPDELRLVEAASLAGVELGLCSGSGAALRWRSGHLVGRERPEVRAATRALADDDAWLYPALLAVTGGDVEIADEIRTHWIEAVEFREAH